MKTDLRILHLEDNALDAELIQSILEGEGFRLAVKRVENRADYLTALEAGGWDLILADFSLPSFDGRVALQLAREKSPDVPFILVSGTIGEAFAIEILKSGATDYVLKTELSGLAPAVRRALDEIEEHTKRKQAEEALRYREELFRTIAETANDAIICQEAPDTITFWNKKAEEMFGYTSEEALGKNLHDLIGPERLRQRSREGLQKFFTTGEGPLINKTVEMAAIRKDGTEFPIELSISPMRIQGKWQATGIIRDISHRKGIEKKA